MSQQEFITGKCSQCGEELRIPAHLETFSCMYCGARLTPKDLVEEMMPLNLEGDPDQLMERVTRDLLSCIAGREELRREISRNRFADAFTAYERSCRPIFDDLDLACRLVPDRRDDLLQQSVNSLLDQLEQRWAAKRGSRALALEEDKMIVAIFLVPMVGRLNLTVSDDFCNLLQQTWVQRYPKYPFYIGSYDAIQEGFKKRFKFCFITTAVCEAQGKPDDCAELTAFRAFRDGYLMETADGPDLVEEYYRIAPQIVAAIDGCADRADRYEAIRRRYLQPCYDALCNGREGECKAHYIRMVRDLEREYLS